MRTPNTECHRCGTPLYRRPADRAKYKRATCPTCLPGFMADTAREKNNKLYREYIQRWLAGEEDGMSGKTSISGHIRRYLWEKHKSRCCRCGWAETNQYTGRIPLEVNHIDGNHRNNRPENLELVCPNCHSLTSSYRALNMGKGRPRKA